MDSFRSRSWRPRRSVLSKFEEGLFLKPLCTSPFGAYLQTSLAETVLAQPFRSKNCVSGRGHDRIATPFSSLPWSRVPHHFSVEAVLVALGFQSFLTDFSHMSY